MEHGNLRIIVLASEGYEPPDAVPGVECAECYERPATRGAVCDGCHVEAVMLATLDLFQRRVEQLDASGLNLHHEREVYDRDLDENAGLCVDCGLRPVDEERRCQPCCRRFVLAQAIEIVKQEYDDSF